MFEAPYSSIMLVLIYQVKVLAEMELWGIGINIEGCLWARNLLGKKLRCLEKEAYKLAGMTFSLYTAADIANVLYGHLKLPVPEGGNKGKQHPSTDKHCLDLLRYLKRFTFLMLLIVRVLSAPISDLVI